MEVEVGIETFDVAVSGAKFENRVLESDATNFPFWDMIIVEELEQVLVVKLE